MATSSIAPTVIHVKRKLVEDPVDQLLIETKRSRRDTVIFQRLKKPLAKPPPTAYLKPEHLALLEVFADQIPQIHASEPGDETRDPLALKTGKPARKVPLAFQRYVDGKRVFDVQPSVDDRMDVDDSKDFVYDVYVKQGSEKEIEENNETVNVGTLSIPVGKEAEWLGDEFWDEKEEDPDRVDTDDEDSNAEDYYGADYPDGEEEDFNDDSDRASGEEEFDPEEYHPGYEVDYDDDEKHYIRSHEDH